MERQTALHRLAASVTPQLRVLGERPLFPVAVYLCIGVYSCTILPVSLAVGLALTALLLLIVLLLSVKKTDATLPLMLLSLAAGYALACAALPAWAADTWEPAGNVALSGRIASAWTTKGGYDGYLLEDVTINGVALAGGVAVTARRGEGEQGRVGDGLTATTGLDRPGPSLHYGGFNARGWHMRQGVRFTAFASSPGIAPARQEPAFAFAKGARRYARQVLYGYMGADSAALVNALLSGDTSGIRQETRLDFMDLGVAHLLAVSGLNISLTAGAAWLLCRKLRVPMSFSLLVSFAVMVCYVLFAGFSPSVMRAAAMWLVMMAGLVLARQYDPLSSLSAAAILILAINPLDLFDVGFQLSFCATAAMFLWLAPVLRRVPDKKWMKTIAASLGVTVCVTLLALPVIAGSFNSISLLSPLANLVLVPASFVLQLSGTALLFAGVLPDAALLLGGVLDGLTSLYLQSVGLLSWAAATLPVAAPPVWLAAAYGALALLASPGVARFKPGGRAATLIALAVLAAVMLSPVSAALTWRSQAAVVAEGTEALSVFWRAGDKNYAACAGSWEALCGYLASRGIGCLEGLYVLGDKPPDDGTMLEAEGKLAVRRLYVPDAWLGDPQADDLLDTASELGIETAGATQGPFECVATAEYVAALLIPAAGGRLAFLPRLSAANGAAVPEALAQADVTVVGRKPAKRELLPDGLGLRRLVLPGAIEPAAIPAYNIVDCGSIEVEYRGGRMELTPWIGGWADGLQGNFR